MANFKQIIEESFSQYSGAVIQSRALIDVRDCLKPSARQIFYCMETDKYTADKPFKKTLKAIGSAMRVYIHGDASCEGIIMRAGQPFAMRYPLIEVEGSYGNPMETANWAAPRYTASRLSPISGVLFKDIKKDTIDDWRDNYDDTEKYPAVLPSKGFYNIVNGTFGIGVGMASSIPQFNLKEVNAALIKLIQNPDVSFDEIYCEPDFATGGILINAKEVKESLKTGTGKACRLRAKIEYDEKKHTLTVTEIPYNVYTNTICKQLEDIANSEKNPGIERINDLTGTTPNLKIYLSKTANPKAVINYLYNNTSLQSSYGINMTMLEMGRRPKVFTWKEALQAHLNHEKVVYRRGFEFDLIKIANRILIVEGIIKAIQNINEVINTIKTSESTKDANEKLQKLLNINEEQAKAILDIKLARLAKLEVEKYENELKELNIEKDRITQILNSTELFNQEIIKGFETVSKKFGDTRRTEITNIEIAKTKEEKEIAAVIPEKVVVAMSEDGMIKRIPASAFKIQKRNGKGVKTIGDVVSSIIKTNTQDSLMVFTDKGRMYRILVNNIPEGTNTSKGTSVKTLIEMNANENPTLIYSIYRDTDAKYVLFVTKNGIVKKTALEEYVGTKKKTGIAAINLKEGDSLVSVGLIKNEDLILLTHNGMAIKFNSTDVSASGRSTSGVKGITLKPDDYVVAALPVRHPEDDLAIISESGLGKRIKLNELILQKRAGKGLIVYKPTDTSGGVVCGALVTNGDLVLITGVTNSICIAATDIPLLSRGSLGNQLIKGTKVTGVSKV